MTEKINRRGVHTPDAFVPDILEEVNVEVVIQQDDTVLSAENCLGDVKDWVSNSSNGKPVEAMAVVDTDEKLLGIVQVDQIMKADLPADTPIEDLVKKQNIYVYNDSKLSFAVDLMDRFQVNYLPVVYRE